jgi:HTH domain found in ParB protein
MVSLANHSPALVSTQHRIDRATARINQIVGATSLQLALSVGSIVVEDLYGGDLGRWRRRGPKERSLRQLANEPSLSISASALYRAMAIYELRVRMHDHPMWEALSVCHIRAVLGLPEHEQRRLLDLALERQWSSKALEEAVASIRCVLKSSRGGRPRKPRFVRSIEHAERAMLDDDTVFGDLEALYAMPSEERQDLARRLSFVRRRCDELSALILI